jgi:hypothetical protein
MRFKLWFLILFITIATLGCKVNLANVSGLYLDENRHYEDQYGNTFLHNPLRITCAIKNIPDFEVLLRLRNKIDDIIFYDTCLITDISFLKNFKGLKRLTIELNDIKTLDSLKYLNNLEYLSINGYSETIDCSLFRNMKNLKWLKIIDNKIGNTEFIFELKNLEELWFGNYETNIDIQNISLLSKLKRLCIASSEIDLTYLATLHRLKDLWLSSPAIINFANLRNPELKYLSLVSNKEYEIAELKFDDFTGLNNLEYLSIVRYKINDVTPLLKLSPIETINFLECVVDITPLLESNKTKMISVDENYYKHIPQSTIEKYGDKIFSVIGW